METYVSLGLDADSFWHLTLRELVVRMNGAKLRVDADFEKMGWQAWHTAALSRVKDFPTLEKFLKIKKRSKSPEEMFALLSGIADSAKENKNG